MSHDTWFGANAPASSAPQSSNTAPNWFQHDQQQQQSANWFSPPRSASSVASLPHPSQQDRALRWFQRSPTAVVDEPVVSSAQESRQPSLGAADSNGGVPSMQSPPAFTDLLLEATNGAGSSTDPSQTANWFEAKGPQTSSASASAAAATGIPRDWFKQQPMDGVAPGGAVEGWFRGQPAPGASDAEIAEWFRVKAAEESAGEVALVKAAQERAHGGASRSPTPLQQRMQRLGQSPTNCFIHRGRKVSLSPARNSERLLETALELGATQAAADVAAAGAQVNAQKHALDAAVVSGDPKAIAQAADALVTKQMAADAATTNELQPASHNQPRYMQQEPLPSTSNQSVVAEPLSEEQLRSEQLNTCRAMCHQCAYEYSNCYESRNQFDQFMAQVHCSDRLRLAAEASVLGVALARREREGLLLQSECVPSESVRSE